ncbi:MAG: flagellin [Phycisphaeraceae bacterium]
MSQINTNVMSMLAQRSLGQQNSSLNDSLQRLSTGLRINRGADDPAGLIASENLRSEKTSISSAISNAERADQVMNIAEGGLTEVSSLLNNLQGLVTQSANDAGLSGEEKEANQLQIDSILQTIDRVAGSTSFQGQKLLNGNFSYSSSDVDTTELTDVKIDAARVPQGGQIDVNVDVTAAAQTGRVFFDNTAVAAGSGEFTIEVAGNDGVQQFTFAEGASTTEIADAVNTFTGATGVTATVDTDDVVFDSSAFGSAGTVTVTKIAGDAAYDDKIFATDAAGVKDGATGANTHRGVGVDAEVNINGQSASVDGLTARVASAGLDVTVDISEALNTAEGDSAFSITGGGATFQLSPELNLAGKASIGIDAVTTGRLGSNGNGFLAELSAGSSANVVNGDVDKAQRVVNDAIGQVSKLRGRIGSFQANTVGATVRALGVALENTSAAESQIRDTDFATETAALTRSQILSQAATNVLSIANSQPQNVLALLG